MFVPRRREVPRRFFEESELGLKDEGDDDLSDHRLFIRTGDDPVMVVAIMRHELEHARQWDVHGDAILAVQVEYLWPALRTRSSGPGAARIYNLAPSELDAHAAAATFVRARHPDAVESLVARDPDNGCPLILLSRSGPEPVETLPFRTLGFASMFREVLDAWAFEHHGRSFGGAVAPHINGAAELWERQAGDAAALTSRPSRPTG